MYNGKQTNFQKKIHSEILQKFSITKKKKISSNEFTTKCHKYEVTIVMFIKTLLT